MCGIGKHIGSSPCLHREKTSIIREKDHALHVSIVQVAGPHAQVAGRGGSPAGVQGHGSRRRLEQEVQVILFILSLLLNAETGYFTEM